MVQRPNPLNPEVLRLVIHYVPAILGILLALSDSHRGLMLVPDGRRIYLILLGAGLVALYLKLRGRLDPRFLLPISLLSILLPPVLLLSLILPSAKESGATKDIGGSLDLLSLSFGTTLVKCESSILAASSATALAKHLAKRRRVVLVDWTGWASDRMEGIEFRLVKPGEIDLGRMRRLGPSYREIVGRILSNILGIDHSLIVDWMAGNSMNLLRDHRVPEPGRSILTKILTTDPTLDLLEALTPSAGVLVIDTSDLPVLGREVLSLLVLAQSAAHAQRDFVPVVPLLSPLTDSRLISSVADELRWLISTLSFSGAFIHSIEGVTLEEEFENVLICGGCDEPISTVDGFPLCPERLGRGERGGTVRGRR